MSVRGSAAGARPCGYFGRMPRFALLVGFALVAVLTWASPAFAGTVFSNSTPIVLPADTPATGDGLGPATPFPSNVTVAGMPGPFAGLTVTLANVNHTFPDDIDMLLVSPTGERTLLMSDVGGAADVNGVTLTFDDAAPVLPDSAAIATGTFRPTNFNTGDTFEAPAPAGPYPDPQGLSRFFDNNPNGTWSLYVRDDVGGDTGNVNGGWSLDVDQRPIAVADTATVSEDAGPEPIDVVANDTDADGGPKQVASVSGAANGRRGSRAPARSPTSPTPTTATSPGPSPQTTSPTRSTAARPPPWRSR